VYCRTRAPAPFSRPLAQNVNARSRPRITTAEHIRAGPAEQPHTRPEHQRSTSRIAAVGQGNFRMPHHCISQTKESTINVIRAIHLSRDRYRAGWEPPALGVIPCGWSGDGIDQHTSPMLRSDTRFSEPGESATTAPDQLGRYGDPPTGTHSVTGTVKTRRRTVNESQSRGGRGRPPIPSDQQAQWPPPTQVKAAAPPRRSRTPIVVMRSSWC
jgi:hypothetical protein